MADDEKAGRCPICEAAPKQPCRAVDGLVLPTVHPERIGETPMHDVLSGPTRQWIVIGTSMVVEARDEHEAVERAEQQSGWHWEAKPVSDRLVTT